MRNIAITMPGKAGNPTAAKTEEEVAKTNVAVVLTAETTIPVVPAMAIFRDRRLIVIGRAST